MFVIFVFVYKQKEILKKAINISIIKTIKFITI